MCYNVSMRKKIFGLLAGILMTVGALTPSMAFACGSGVKFFGLDPWYAGLSCSDGKTIDQSEFQGDNLRKSVLSIIGVVVKDLLFVVGMVSVVMIIVGGAQYILSAGNPAAVAKASRTISGSLIGLAISACAYGIVTLVLKAVGGM